MASAQTARSGGFADDPLLLCLGIKFAMDSLLEGSGFEPSVPLWRMAPGPVSAELREVPAGQFAVRT
jgi:hypothetical protein